MSTDPEETSKAGESDDGGSCLRRLGCTAVALVGAAALALAAGYGHYRATMAHTTLESGETRIVHIETGDSWSSIVETLEEAELMPWRPYVEIWARQRGVPRKIKAGTYRFEGPLAPTDVFARLQRGTDGRDVAVTFPEGWTIFDIADRLEAKDLVEREAFLKAARDPELLAESDLEGADSFEGYLFPDTYRFRPDPSAEAVVETMHHRWREVWQKLETSHASSLQSLKDSYDFDRHDLVTIASIVQAETRLDDERPIIAQVVLNRLDASMRLQMDPTCAYGEDRYDEEPTPEMCDDPSNAYSTYAHDGLPPGPIGNPGRESLEGALDPAESEEAKSYLYYVARQDGTGRHVFSETYREHRRAVDKYLK